MLAMVSMLMLAACANGDDSDEADTSILPMTIVEWLYAPAADRLHDDPFSLMHVSWDPMGTGENTISVEITDMMGDPASIAATDLELQLAVTPLTPDSEPMAAELERDGNTWTANDVDLADTGWYQLDVILTQNSEVIAEGETWALLPDPSVHGSEAIDLPASDRDADALYQRALDTYAGWEAAEWRESLSSGAGALVVTEFTVTDREDEPPAMHVESRYVGAFRENSDGSAPAPPRFDFGRRITIGEAGWLQDASGNWLTSSARGSASFDERADVYRGGTNVQFGGTAIVNGIDTEIITFYLPEKAGQSEAWFAWWVDPETGNLLQAMMIAQMHYMVWNIDNINNDETEIHPPQSVATPPTG